MLVIALVVGLAVMGVAATVLVLLVLQRRRWRRVQAAAATEDDTKYFIIRFIHLFIYYSFISKGRRGDGDHS